MQKKLDITPPPRVRIKIENINRFIFLEQKHNNNQPKLRMKKYYTTSLIALVALSASAETLVWNGKHAAAASSDISLTNPSNWLIDGTSQAPSTLNPTDNWILDYVKGDGGSTDLKIEESIQVASIYSNKGSAAGSYNNIKLMGNTLVVGSENNSPDTKVLELYKSTRFTRHSTAEAGSALHVYGSVELGAYTSADITSTPYYFGWSSEEVHTTITGNVDVHNGASIFFAAQNAGTQTYDLSAPTVKIDGVINFLARMTSGREVDFGWSTDATTKTLYSIGGFQGLGRLKAQYSNAVIMLTNQHLYDFNGDLYETENGKISFIMNGAGTQRFSNASESDGRLQFSGGVTVKQGRFEMSGLYKNADGDFVTRTDASYGALTMEGGEFAVIKNDNATSAIKFDNIVYSGGTIEINVGDLITLATGGTISLADGYEGNVQFNIVGLDSMELNQAIKIISWDTDTNIDDSRFVDVNLLKEDSLMFAEIPYAEFSSEADGLYVYLAQIPEPATWAGIFGVIALGFAIYRRRK